MSGLARLALNKNIVVTGSDIASNHFTHSLCNDGASISLGHSYDNIHPDMTVIYSTDIKQDNPEFLAAKNHNCEMLHRSELLQILMQSHQSLAVAGTHGKTTTSSLLTWVLESCGESPSYAIGGIIPQLSSNSGTGNGKHFVAEACESDGTFLNYSPFGAILTNIDFDHMDFYGTESALISAFKSFTAKVSSHKHLFWCGDDVHLRKLNPQGVNYGFGNNCRLKATNFKQKEWILSFDAELDGVAFKNVEVALTGKHNALNALAVFGLALALGLKENDVRKGLITFGGVLRRCEKKGEVNGILFLDDYAHHPTELKATISAVRHAIGERRLIIVYQPHRYTRTQDCKGMYEGVFSDADELFITEIYAAREKPIPGVSHEIVVSEARGGIGNRCHHINRASIVAKISDVLRPHDVFLTLGAGDITLLCGEVMENIALKAPPKLKLGLVFGGMSVEHDISLISSANIFAALNKKYYDIEQFGITREGNWLHGNDVRMMLVNLEEKVGSSKISGKTLNAILDCDILFPVLHGTCGEDGTIQGLFDVFSKAYVGCDHRSSSICMDKVLSKRLALDTGIATVPYVSFDRFEWDRSSEKLIEKINQELCFPVFVKPIHLGSSIGVHKVSAPNMLSQAIKGAFRFDNNVLVENGIENVREIEFSLLGNDDVVVFPPGEVHSNGRLHDYDSKYGLNPAQLAAGYDPIAKLSEEKIAEGMALAKAVYKTLGCCGLARIDTFLDSEGKFWFNEINPIPGFTKYSLYPLMCEANGLKMDRLMDRLVVLGLHRKRQLERLEFKNKE